MIRCRNKIFPKYFIDPETAIITNSKDEIQKTYIKDGRPYFKGMAIHVIQVHTHIVYKKGYAVHHIDENKMNNSLSNLAYITQSEHAAIHKKGNRNMFGKHHSNETKRKIGKGNKGKKLSEETKQKISEAHKGKKHSSETKQKMSEAHKDKKHSSETKQKMSATMKGKNTWSSNTIWVNNGVIAKMVKCDDIPEGFVRGRLKNEKRKI